MESWKQTLADMAGDRLMSLKRQAFLLCGDDGQAEDLVQDALVRAFARPLRAPAPGAAEAYVRVIMVNLFIDGVRRQSRWNRAASLLTRTETITDPADQVLDRDVMLTALGDLSPRQRACVVLRYYQDLPVTDIAAVLGVAEGTVKRHLSEAIARLALRLSPAEN
jgi:RNA polymerase sigma-70 factor (sigma-E family)